MMTKGMKITSGFYLIYTYSIDRKGRTNFIQFKDAKEMNDFCEQLGSDNDDRTHTSIKYMFPSMQILTQIIELDKQYEEDE